MRDLFDILDHLDVEDLHAICASRQMFNDAAFLFSRAPIREIEWLPDRSLSLIVADSGNFPKVNLRPWNQQITAKCSCGGRAGDRICAHALVSLMTIMHVRRGTNFSLHDPPEEYLRRVSKSLEKGGAASADILGGTEIHASIRLDPTQPSRAFQYHAVHGKPPRPVPMARPPLEVASFVDAKLAGDAAQEAFLRWLPRSTGRIPTTLILGREEISITPAEVPNLPFRLALDAEPEVIRFRPWLISPPGEEDAVENWEIPVLIGHSLFYYQEQKRLVSGKPPVYWQTIRDFLVERFNRAISRSSQSSGAAFSPLSLGVVAAAWNLTSHALPFSASDLPQTLVDGSPMKPPVEPLGYRIEIRTTPIAEGGEPGPVEIALSTHAKGLSLPHLLAYKNWEDSLAWRYADLDKVLPDPKKATILAEYMADLLGAADGDERLSETRRVLEAIEQDTALGLPKTRSTVQRFAKKLLAGIHAADKEKHALLHLDGNGLWFQVQPRQAELGTFLNRVRRRLGLWMAEAHRDEEGIRVIFTLTPEQMKGRLPQVASIAQELGAELLYGQKPVQFAKLDLEVRLNRAAAGGAKSGKIDWFEVHPTVKCGGVDLEERAWQQMLTQGFLEDDQGEVRVLDLESAEALESFRNLLENQRGEAAPRKGAKGGKKQPTLAVPRLRLLDWMAMQAAGVQCVLPEEDREALEALTSGRKVELEAVPGKLNAELREYQQEGYSWLAFLYRQRFGACLADDMGLGKTVQVISLLAALKDGTIPPHGDRQALGPHLIVLPPTLLFNWQRELEKFAPHLNVTIYGGAKRAPGWPGYDVVLTSYELVRRDIELLEKESFHIIVFDEAQHVKNLAGARAQAMRQLRGVFKICLTGTPLENHLGEYFAILELAVPGLLGNARDFKEAVENQKPGVPSPLLRAKPFVLRRTKKLILKDLPPKTESDIYLDLSEEQKRLYTAAVAEVRQEVMDAYRDKPAQLAGITALAALTRLRQICISPSIFKEGYNERSPKLTTLLEKLQELKEEGYAALVFSQFTRALDLAQAACEEDGIDYFRMDGSTPTPQRQKLVEAFQQEDGPQVFLISLKTGGAGLNLTRASYVFHLDPWWNPAVENQASDRAHRIGQNQAVFVQRLLMRHSVEEKIMKLKERKSELFEAVMTGGTRTQGGALSRDDFEFLLRPGEGL
jgi:superfamily II DNA or RNA helicase